MAASDSRATVAEAAVACTLGQNPAGAARLRSQADELWPQDGALLGRLGLRAPRGPACPFRDF